MLQGKYEYEVMLEEHTRRQLKINALEVTSMVHDRRPTLGETSDALCKVKVGDWIEVEGDFSTGNCSVGGIGCVTCVFNHCDGANALEVPMVDVHYLLTNTRENNVDIGRVTVIPMPFRTSKAQMRPCNTIANPSPKGKPSN